MPERQDEGAGHQGKGDPEAVREEAPKLDDLVPPPDPPRQPEPRRRFAPQPQPVTRQVMGGQDRPATERSTAEILALEEDLENEREKASRSLEEIQRRLEEAEARAPAGGVTVTDARAREDAADWLREQRGDVRRELESELEGRMLAREKELVGERDQAAAALKDALERLEQVERAGGDDEEARADAERKARERADRRLSERTEQLKAQIAAMETETEARIEEAVEEARREAEEQVRAELSEEATGSGAEAEEILSAREHERMEETRADTERRIRRELEQELAKRIAAIKSDADTRTREEIDAARRASELRFQSELEIREQTLSREREAATQAAAAAQRRFDEIAEQIEAAGRRVEGAEAKLAEEQTRLQQDTEERLDSELRRLQAESDAKIAEALTKVEADTQARMEQQAERRLAEHQETESKLGEEIQALRSQLELERSSRDDVIKKAEDRAKRAEAKVSDVAAARLDAEAETRNAAAEWVRGQTRALQRDAEKGTKEAIAAARRETTTKVTAEVEEQMRKEFEKTERETDGRIKREVAKARREAEDDAERSFAEREQGLALELEEAGRALKSVEHQLRETETRAESAVSKLGEVSDEDAKEAAEEREGRFQALEGRIKSVMDRASGAQAHAASVGIELPERAEDEVQPTDEQEAVEPAEPRWGFFQRRAAKRAEKRAAREKEVDAKKETRAKAAQERKEKATAAKSRAQAKRASRSSAAKTTPAKDPLDVNKATFEQWRGLGMSVTEATRVIAYRERQEGFKSVDGLDSVPGMPKKLLDEIKDQLTV